MSDAIAREKLIDRIRKMHAKAESARAIGSEAEAESFALGVKKMLDKYKLDMSDLEYSQMQASEPIEREYVPGTGAGRRVAWLEHLAALVAGVHHCRILINSKSDLLILVGRRTDRECAAYVFNKLKTFALENSDREARRFRKQLRATVGATVGYNRDFRAGWLAGFVARIADRYREAEAAQREAARSSGTSLIRLTNALAEVDASDAMADTVPAKQPPMSRSTANRAGREAGDAAGGRVNLDADGLGTSPTQQRLGGR